MTRSSTPGSSAITRYAGGWALITGAARAEGLGYAFARYLAEAGLNLVLVDVLADDLGDRAADLAAAYPVQVRTVVCDLGDPGPWPALETVLAEVEIDLLICNHMYTPKDTPPILDMALEVHHQMIDINARAYTTLVHRIGTEMRARNRGGIVIVPSGAGLTSAPFTAAYSANKAFQIALGEALWFELRETAVDVLVVVAGLMNTQVEITTGGYPKWLIAEPDDVVAEVLTALGKQHLVMPGRPNRLMMFAQTRLSSRRRTVTSVGQFMAKGLGK